MPELKILQCFYVAPRRTNKFFCTHEELFKVINTWIYPVWITQVTYQPLNGLHLHMWMYEKNSIEIHFIYLGNNEIYNIFKI